jgi:hypothetical protein
VNTALRTPFSRYKLQVLRTVNINIMVFQVMRLYSLVNRYLPIFQTTWHHILEHQSLTIHEVLSLFSGCKKKKVVFPIHAMTASRGRKVITAHILNVSTRWTWADNFTPQLLYAQEGTPVSLG